MGFGICMSGTVLETVRYNVTMTLFGMGIDEFSQFAQDRPKAFIGPKAECDMGEQSSHSGEQTCGE